MYITRNNKALRIYEYTNMTFESLEVGPHENGTSASTSFNVKAGLAQMLKGGVIMDVVNAEQVLTLPPMEPTSPQN